MVEAYVIAVVAFVAMVLYAFDSAETLLHAQPARRLARVFLLLLLTTIPVAYVDIAGSQESLLWRQWVVGAAVSGVAGGYAALLWDRFRHP